MIWIFGGIVKMEHFKAILKSRSKSSVSEIFLKWHLSRFTWTELAYTKVDVSALKELVDECLHIERLKLVCKAWEARIIYFFCSGWNITSWKDLTCLSFFPVYDFTGLPAENRTKRAIIREFLFVWIGTSIDSNDFTLVQRRPDLDRNGIRRYDTHSAEELQAQKSESFLEVNFEYVALGHPQTGGGLDNSYGVEVLNTNEGSIVYTYGKGARDWTKQPGAEEQITLENFISLMNYPQIRPQGAPTLSEEEADSLSDEEPFFLTSSHEIHIDPSLQLRYEYDQRLLRLIDRTVLTFLCISRFSQESPIYLLPRELILMIIDLLEVPKRSGFESSRSRGGCSIVRCCKDKELDPWRLMLHRK